MICFAFYINFVRQIDARGFFSLQLISKNIIKELKILFNEQEYLEYMYKIGCMIDRWTKFEVKY